MLLATGGFMLMPFGSAFTVNNLGISLHQLPWVYMVTGVSSMVSGPLLGRLADRIGKYATFCLGSVLAAVVVVIYCNLGLTLIVIQTPAGLLRHYDVLGYVVVGAMTVTLALLYPIHRAVMRKVAETRAIQAVS
jgi:predicted MFS family arabinose efflux permease